MILNTKRKYELAATAFGRTLGGFLVRTDGQKRCVTGVHAGYAHGVLRLHREASGDIDIPLDDIDWLAELPLPRVNRKEG